MELVTGYHGVNHVTAEQLADLQAGILGGDYVLNIGEKLRCDIVTSNKIRIFDGVIVFGGKQAIIEAGDYEDITIENGTLGLYRNDIVVVKYVKDEETGIEGTTLEVLKGATASEAVDPLYTTNDIRSGAFESEIPLYRVKLNGLAIEAVEPMFEVSDSIKGLSEVLASVNSSLKALLYHKRHTVPSITISANMVSASMNIDVTLDGYKAIGIVGSNTISSWVTIVQNLLSYSSSGDYLYYSLRNFNSIEMTVAPIFDVLYIKST